MNRNLGILALRLAFGFQLVKVSYENVVHPTVNMPQFVAYLESLGFPFPTPGAYLSAYTEFIGGILWLLGLQTRLSSVFILINFGVALGMAHLHINDGYQNTMSSLNLIAVAIFLLLNGAGRYSIDERFSRMK